MKDINEIVSALFDGTLQESETIELKRTLPQDLPNIAKTIVGIANSGGGYLILGAIEQPRDGGMIVGLDNAAAIQSRLAQILSEYTIGVQGTPYIYTINSKRVVVFRIEKAESVAYYSRRQTSPARLIAYTRSTIGSRIKEVAEEKKYYVTVYKYMTIEAFLMSLYTKTWRFFEPSKWNDKYEQRFYCANYQIDGAKNVLRPNCLPLVLQEKRTAKLLGKCILMGKDWVHIVSNWNLT
ncbi:AlbA family DNA-binding domain-containing protein [Prevotella sp.]|uniref:AlbA family DNA-binding domain-containing protein n=1 Tax=Prevotella sp. TaxID=59823 RepID=UPI00307B82F4